MSLPTESPTANLQATQTATALPMASAAPAGAYPAPEISSFSATKPAESAYPLPESTLPPVATVTLASTSGSTPQASPEVYPPPQGTEVVFDTLSFPSATPATGFELGGGTPSPTALSLTPQPTRVRVTLTPSEVSSITLAAGKPQLIMFYADWCNLCLSLAPVILNLEGQYLGRVNFVYLNVEDPATRDLQEALGYQLIAKPHIYLLDTQGNTLREWIGYVSIEMLQEALQSIGV